MSLFDDNFIISMEAKAKAAKEDDEEVKEPAESNDDPELELTDEEKVEVECAVNNDINAKNFKEATGFDSLIAKNDENVHYACLEAVTDLIELSKFDVECTEAYYNATSQYEKQIITENFKEKVKMFGARFKQFLIKIKNAVIRIFNKAVNYVKIFASKISAKFASKVKLDSSKKINDNVTINISEALTRPFGNMVTRIMMSKSDSFFELSKLIKSLQSTDISKAKEALNNIEVPKKQDLVNNALRGGYSDVKLASMQNDGENMINQLKTIDKNVDMIKGWRKQMESVLSQAENVANSGDNTSPEKINVLTSAVNKAMGCFNARVGAMVSLQSLWVNQRIKIIRALSKYQGKKMPDTEEKENKSDVHESANIFDAFLNAF